MAKTAKRAKPATRRQAAAATVKRAVDVVLQKDRLPAKMKKSLKPPPKAEIRPKAR